MTMTDTPPTVDDRPAAPRHYESHFASPLPPDELRAHQQRYLDMPRERYGLPARLLFWTTRRVFPQGRSFEFFAFVELVARVPYMAWEHVGDIAQTQKHRDHRFARRIHDRVLLTRDEQFDTMTWVSKYRDDDGHHATVADMLRQVARDEEMHKTHYRRRAANRSAIRSTDHLSHPGEHGEACDDTSPTPPRRWRPPRHTRRQDDQ